LLKKETQIATSFRFDSKQRTYISTLIL